MLPDATIESRPGRASGAVAAACLLMAAQVVCWHAALGGQDLHAGLGVAGALLLAGAGAWALRRGVRLDMPWPAFRGGQLPFLLLGVLYFATWFAHQAFRYASFEFANFDLGIYSNVAFNTAHGHPFYSSLLAHSHLGEHFSPITALFAPLYALKPSVLWLLGAQCLSFAAVPLVLVRVCRGLIPDRARAHAVALALSLVWGIYPPMAAAMRFPFHPSTLAAPWVLLSFYWVQRREWRKAAPALLGLLLFKESLALVWVGFGLHLLATRRRREGLLLVAGGAAAAAIMLALVIPAFREGDWGQAGRIGPLADPAVKFWYVVRLLVPLLGLPLLGWRGGLVALPSILLNLSTLYPPQYSSRFQYDDVIAPLLFVGAIVGFEQVWSWTRRWRAWWHTGLAVLAIYVAAVFQLQDSPLRYVWAHPPTALHLAMNEEMACVQRDYPGRWIYVQSHLGPQVHRHEVRQFPINSRDCGRERYRPGTLIVLSEHVNPWGFRDLAACLAELDAHPDRFVRRPEYTTLHVYEVR